MVPRVVMVAEVRWTNSVASAKAGFLEPVKAGSTSRPAKVSPLTPGIRVLMSALPAVVPCLLAHSFYQCIVECTLRSLDRVVLIK